MKLVVCIVHNRDRNRVVEELIKAGFKATVIGSTGGFLREGNTTLLVGAEEEDIEALKTLIRSNCQTREQMVNVVAPEAGVAGAAGAFGPGPVKVPVGGAVVFVLNVDEFYRC